MSVNECIPPCDQHKLPEESYNVYERIQQREEQLKQGVELADKCPYCKVSAMGTFGMITHNYECIYKKYI